MRLMIANESVAGGDVQLSVSEWEHVARSITSTTRGIALARAILREVEFREASDHVRIFMTRDQIDALRAIPDRQI